MPAPPLSPYQRKLFAFLSVASFFEGYDFIALTQILPNFRADMGVSKAEAGLIVTAINAGTIVAYLLLRRADRWGRKRLLTLTIAGYTVFTFLTAFAPTPWVFAALQMAARIFLIGEYTTSMIVVSEEFPEARRGMAVGVVAAFSSLGSIVCAGLVPILVKTDLHWRAVYLASIVPLLLLAFARRGLQETRRFAAQAHDGAARPFLYLWHTPYRRRLVLLGAVWFCAYIASQNAVTFWKDFAVTERGLTDAEVGKIIASAAVVATPLVFFVGKVMDVIGRRPTAAIVFFVGSLGTWLAYTAWGRGLLTVSLVLAIFSASGFLPVLNAMTAELFPTELRAEGFGWANNLIGRIGYMVSPAILGVFAQDLGWGPVIRLTAIFPIITTALVFAFLPETKGETLERTSEIA